MRAALLVSALLFLIAAVSFLFNAHSAGEGTFQDSATTDASGNYSLDLSGQKTYDLSIQKEGALELEAEITLPEGPAEVHQDFE